jgi:hypothetical protein
VKGFRSACATALTIGLLAGASAGTAAQSEEPSGPITPVTGIRAGSEDVQWPDPVVDPAGVLHLHGTGIVQTIEWSDSRLPATMILTGNTDVYGEEGDPNGGAVYTGALVLQGDEGSWTGTQFGYFPPDPVIAAMTLEGTGAYEGLSAILYQTYADATAQQEDIVSFEGIIIEGQLPPFPDPPVPGTE